MHPGNKCCLKPHIQRGRWEVQFKDSCCRDSSAEHVACGKCPCGSREGSSCHLGGVSKLLDFMQIISEMDPFAFSTPGWCHLQERRHLDTVHLQTSVCLVTGYDHPEKTWKLWNWKVRCWRRMANRFCWSSFICWLIDFKQFMWAKTVALHLVQELQSGCLFKCRLCLPISEALSSVKGNGLLISSFSYLKFQSDRLKTIMTNILYLSALWKFHAVDSEIASTTCN